MDLPVNYNDLHATERRAVREHYIAIQHGLCYHCGEPLAGGPSGRILSMRTNRQLFPPDFFRWPVHLHHDHETGMTIGAVHCYCNAVLWQYHGE